MRDLLIDVAIEALAVFDRSLRREGYATDFLDACLRANPFEGPYTLDGLKHFGKAAIDAYAQLVSYKVTMSLVAGCLTAVAKRSTSQGAMLGACRNTITWWTLSNSYQEVAFGRLPIVRFYHAVNARLCPTFLLNGFAGSLGSSTDDGSQYEERVMLEGVVKAVLYRNAIPTAAQMVVDHSEFVYHYIKSPHLYRRTLRAHAVTTAVEVAELGLGLAVRCIGAAAVYKVLPQSSRVCGAFVAENALLLLSSLLLTRRLISPLAARVESKMCQLLPPTQIEMAEDEREAEEEAAAYRKLEDEVLSGWHKGEESPYTILDVPIDASKDEIKKKYRQLALQMHPDKIAHLPREQKEAMEIRFKKVASAYQILSDDDKRRLYATESGEQHSRGMLKLIEHLPIYVQLPILLSIMGGLMCSIWGLGFAKFHTAFRNFTAGGVIPLRLWYPA